MSIATCYLLLVVSSRQLWAREISKGKSFNQSKHQLVSLFNIRLPNKALRPMYPVVRKYWTEPLPPAWCWVQSQTRFSTQTWPWRNWQWSAPVTQLPAPQVWPSFAFLGCTESRLWVFPAPVITSVNVDAVYGAVCGPYNNTQGRQQWSKFNNVSVSVSWC